MYKEKAKELFSQKFHCSQAVLGAFSDELGITLEQALKLGGCFGSGMCKGEVCGACTGALMVLGLKYGQASTTDLESRAKSTEVTKRFLDTFKEKNGSYICSELLKYDITTKEGLESILKNNLFTEFCPLMVESAVLIVEEIIKEND